MLTYADVCWGGWQGRMGAGPTDAEVMEAVLCQEEACAVLLLKKSVVRAHQSMLTDADGC
jgi:hypothetical protein